MWESHGEEEALDQDHSIRINITMTVRELWQYYMRLMFRGVYKIYYPISIFAGIYVIVDTWKEISPLYRGLLIAGYVVIVLYKPLYTYWRAYREVRWSNNQGSLIISLGEEGIEAVHGENVSFVPWSKIEEAEQVGTILVLQTIDDVNYLIPDSSAGFHKPRLEAMLINKMPPKRRKRI